jgi:hypothetical protein
MLPMRLATAPTHAATARPPEKLAGATGRAVSKAGAHAPLLEGIANMIGSADDDLLADLCSQARQQR